MEGRDILRSIEPLQGRVVPIKTVQETQTTEEFEDAYVAEVNVKLASKVVK
jgi:tRNA-specific adenosine deaminase 3